MSLKGPSVAYMKGQSGTVANLLAKKRLVLGWSNYYFVFVPKNRRLYQYRSELVGWRSYGVDSIIILYQ